MTEEEMDKFSDLLAEKVFKLIMNRQADLDQQFIEQVKASGQDIINLNTFSANKSENLSISSSVI